MESKPEFRLPADGPDSASGAAERLDAVCGDGEQAEDFCNHGAGILAGLVGQKLSYPPPFLESESHESQKRNGRFGISLPKTMHARLHPAGAKPEHTEHETLRTLVHRLWNFPLRLRPGGIFVEPLGREDGAPLRGHFRVPLGGLGRADVARIRLGMDGGAGVHGISGRRLHLARRGGMDRSFGGRTEALRSIAHLAHAGGRAGFHRGAGEKPAPGLKSAVCRFFGM